MLKRRGRQSKWTEDQVPQEGLPTPEELDVFHQPPGGPPPPSGSPPQPPPAPGHAKTWASNASPEAGLPTVFAFDDRQHDAVTRRRVVYVLLLMLTGTLAVGTWGLVQGGQTWADTKDYIAFVVVPLITLTSSAVAFYFASK